MKNTTKSAVRTTKVVKSVNRPVAQDHACTALELETLGKYVDAKSAWLKALALCLPEAEYHCHFGIERCEFHMNKQRQLSYKHQQELAA